MAKQTIFYFKQAGLYTTLQDLGCSGQQHLGVPVGGAMDRTSAKIANWLVGNEENLPVLEITLMGPSIVIEGDCQIALTGANMSPKLDGKPIAMYKTIPIKSASILTFGKLKNGCRTYIAIRGMRLSIKYLDKNTPFINNLGLNQNTLISTGSELIFETKRSINVRKLEAAEIPNYNNNINVRVLPGPEFQSFSKNCIKSFFQQLFHISNQSNRVGFRLVEAVKSIHNLKEIISSGIVPGTIQITNSGQPIILMKDAPTIGGYARFVNIISADLDKVAQLKPGDEVSFSLFKKNKNKLLIPIIG